MDRIAISKSIRFEIFKRDYFKCQYCGAAAPEVLLHVDHIRPVADGGTNDITNLITSCQGCNLGKGKNPLSENAAVEKSRRQMEELQERREQLELMMEWQQGLSNLKDETTTKVAEFWMSHSHPYVLSDTGMLRLKKLCRKFEVSEVIKAIKIASESYLKVDEDGVFTKESAELAFEKIGGICAIEQRSKEKPYLKDLYYIRAILAKRLDGRWYVAYEALNYLENAYLAGIDVDSLKDIVLRSYTWSKFTDLICEAIRDAK